MLGALCSRESGVFFEGPETGKRLPVADGQPDGIGDEDARKDGVGRGEESGGADRAEGGRIDGNVLGGGWRGMAQLVFPGGNRQRTTTDLSGSPTVLSGAVDPEALDYSLLRKTF